VSNRAPNSASRGASSAAPEEAPPPPEEVLTTRELEVLGLVAEGATNQEIAERLVISPSTVKTHVKSILRKLGARNRTEAGSQYLRRERGLLGRNKV